jgi:hypothetical protein
MRLGFSQPFIRVNAQWVTLLLLFTTTYIYVGSVCTQYTVSVVIRYGVLFI